MITNQQIGINTPKDSTQQIVEAIKEMETAIIEAFNTF